MKKVYLLIFSLISFLSLDTFSATSIKSLKFSKKQNKGVMTINYSGNLKDYPELKINKNSIYVIIPDSSVKKVINKKVQFTSNHADTNLHASNFTNNRSRIKVLLPFNIDKAKEQVSLMLKDNQIELSFPKLKVDVASVASHKKNKLVSKKYKEIKDNKKVAKDILNEEYLNTLIQAQKAHGSQKYPLKNITTKRAGNTNSKATLMPNSHKDEVKTTQAAGKRSLLGTSKSSFSLVEYGGKFVAFLGVVLLLFYGVITIMKKGFINKGKLGFLNKTEQVTVLSQTYIAPKKSLMLIRAHNQVFLVSNTDSGIHPISEIKDVAGLLKEGELKITGDNFDTNFEQANKDEKVEQKVKLKEDIMHSNQQSSLSDFINVKDKVKFSESLKKKVKNLKPLQ